MINNKRKQMQQSDSFNDDESKKMRLELGRSTSVQSGAIGVRDPRLSRLQNEPQKSISLDPTLPTSSSSSDISKLLTQEKSLPSSESSNSLDSPFSSQLQKATRTFLTSILDDVKRKSSKTDSSLNEDLNASLNESSAIIDESQASTLTPYELLVKLFKEIRKEGTHKDPEKSRDIMETLYSSDKLELLTDEERIRLRDQFLADMPQLVAVLFAKSPNLVNLDDALSSQSSEERVQITNNPILDVSDSPVPKHEPPAPEKWLGTSKEQIMERLRLHQLDQEEKGSVNWSMENKNWCLDKKSFEVGPCPFADDEMNDEEGTMVVNFDKASDNGEASRTVELISDDDDEDEDDLAQRQSRVIHMPEAFHLNPRNIEYNKFFNSIRRQRQSQQDKQPKQ